MRIKQVSEELSISGQMMPIDMQALADRGYRSVICNRPDNESTGQPTFREIKKAAKKAGMEAKYIPIGFGGLLQQQLDDFASAVQEMPGPVLAFCLSGARSSMMATRTQPRPAGAGNNLMGAMRNLGSMFAGRT